ncbi:metallophosphoesterase family protein [Flavilitoribacter nigricans]|uniref:Diadenosine tetraphosphatase n=1 Tax=Flavilitoribacter nigricans (strain ATCC 23147 / DSM 23189 / NBRC 102662 / NCIMB 1420 / SS-2) TaxID=1122177 RepID=A0A2D0NDD3_FLAN2|nr:metallophosphoesterase family protein [Flavilitoribacter nigricans]PHN06521.1 diadenosine tetraphosphatase [Flavilitoribacter nigricans DSM 23189 = NBRC 102662]
MNTKDIGNLNGPLLVFGGVYSNLQALEALQELAAGMNIPAERIICTGDVVGYCAQPEAVVQKVRDWGIHCIAGNVELQLASGADHCGCDFRTGSRCDSFSQDWYPYAKTHLSPASIDWMQQLPDQLQFTFAGKKVRVLHGSYREVAGYVFASTPWNEKMEIFEECKSEVVLAGHCGLPFADTANGYYWLNAGVIGMPANDGTPRVWCMLLEEFSTSIAYRFLPVEYNFLLAQQFMRNAGLPEAYALTLSTGLWDNCEILPETETRAQGKMLELDRLETSRYL